MQLTTKRDVLLETLGKVKSAALSKSSLPVLANVLLTAGKGQFQIIANNLEVALIGTCKAKVTKAGGIGVPPKVLENFLRQVDADTVKLAVKVVKTEYQETEYNRDPETNEVKAEKVTKTRKNLTLVVEAGRASFTTPGHDPKDFPPLPKITGKPITINALDKAIGEVLYATAKEENRPVLTGVCISPHNGSIELAATDGFRLAITHAKSTGKLKEQLIIPGAAASMIKRLLPGNVKAVVLGKDERDKAIAFHQNNGLTILAKMVAGAYPKYDQLVPKGGTMLKVSAAELRKAINTALIIQPSANKVRLQTKGNALTVSAQQDDRETRAVVTAHGRIKAGFNGLLLRDLTCQIGNTMVLRMKDPQSPGVVKNNGTTHVLMPMSVQW